MFMGLKGAGTPYDENEILVDSIIQYREAFEMFMTEVTGRNQDIVQEMGGLKPEFYEIYTKLVVLNESCERFLNALG